MSELPAFEATTEQLKALGIEDTQASRRRWRRAVAVLLRDSEADGVSVYEWALMHQKLYALLHSE